MIFDGYNPSAASSQYDLCIAGTGIAGQRLFHQLRRTSLRIALIESGGREPDEQIQRLKECSCDGLRIDFASRERYLGGTANTWQYICVPHDEIDFQKRPWVTHPGWPFDKDELDPYYDRAADFFRIPRPRMLAETIRRRQASAMTLDDDVFQTTLVVHTDRPNGFDATLYKELETSDRHDLFLHANLIDIDLGENGDRATAFKLRALGAPPFFIAAERFVLAWGGIENARVLLMAQPGRGRGVGNSSGAVGRFFMDHRKGEYGAILPAREVSDLGPHQAFYGDGRRYGCGLRMTARAQERFEILNGAVRLLPKYKSAGSGQAKRLSKIVIKNFHEMTPCETNRVSLGKARDALGCPKAVISCRLSESDKRTMIVFHTLLTERPSGRSGWAHSIAIWIRVWAIGRSTGMRRIIWGRPGWG